MTVIAPTSATSRGRQSTPGRAVWRIASWLLFGVAVLVWAVFFRPVELGGPVVAASVVGTSMEPALHTGDLVFARTASEYRVGDLIVFEVDDGSTHGRVIHRIVARTPGGGFTTQGDNRATPDSWVVEPTAILGAYWFHIPAIGVIAQFAAAAPPLAGLIAAALAGLAFVPFRRARRSPALEAALQHATRERIRLVPSRAAFAVVVSGIVGCAASAAGAVWLYMARSTNVILWIALLVAASSALLVMRLAMRELDGVGQPEPEHSMRVLGPWLSRVDTLPASDAVSDVASSEALRAIVMQHRLPVLHCVDESTGTHEFLVMTDDLSWRWVAEEPTRRD